MKKEILFTVFAVVVIILLVVCYKIYNSNKNNIEINTLTIKEYEIGTTNVTNTINVTNTEKIKELNKIMNRIKPLSKDNTPKLAILNEIEIIINDNIYINIQSKIEDFCLYNNKEFNISGLARMPEGLMDWLEDII